MSNKNFENWAELLAAKTSIQGDCLIWTEGCHSQGYPMTRWDGEMVLVKRKVMEDKLGTTLERGRRVKNTCGNQLCVNVDHYFVAEQGTKEWIAGTSKYLKQTDILYCKCMMTTHIQQQELNRVRLFTSEKHM